MALSTMIRTIPKPETLKVENTMKHREYNVHVDELSIQD